MPLDHSLEGQLAYNRRRSVWPPPDLQIDSGKLVRKTSRALSNVAQRIGLKDSLRSTKPKSTVLSQEREPLGLKPRRALTIKDNTTENHELAVSPLFRLPLGIRQTIYKHVLGNSNIHIVSIRGGQELRHLRCNCTTCPGFAFYIERGKWKREWICNDYNYDSGPKNLYTNLLRTCRQVYSEAIELLYSSNVFSFKDPKVLQNFVAWTLPSRHSSITTVHVDLHIPQQRNIGQGTKENNPNHELNPWDNAWGALGTLPSLQHIQIRVHPIESAHPGSPNLLERVEALGKSQSLKTCRFYFPEEFEPEEWMSEAPFEVVALDEWEWDHNFTRRPLTVF